MVVKGYGDLVEVIIVMVEEIGILIYEDFYLSEVFVIFDVG